MISIIIPLYNVEEYITNCLRSLENQTYKNFEVIIINDGSTDNSSEVVETYMQKSKMNIRLINQKNGGVSSARNKGLKYAVGDYICFVDSDDIVVSNYLDIMVGISHKESCDLFICGIKLVKNDLNEAIDGKIYNPDNTLVMNTNEALKKFLFKDLICGIGSFLVKREILINSKLMFSEGYRYSEDQEFIWKLINCSKRIAYNEVELYFYRMRINSAMSIIDIKRLDGLKLMIKLEDYFDKENPLFKDDFRKFGVARWVWATMWQVALGSNDFNSFKLYASKLNSFAYFKKLLVFPEKKVRFSSMVYLISPRLFYYIIRFVVPKTPNTRRSILGKP